MCGETRAVVGGFSSESNDQHDIRQEVVTNDRDFGEFLVVSDHFPLRAPETGLSHWPGNCDAGVTERTFGATRS
jgi:hypothetical protein